MPFENYEKGVLSRITDLLVIEEGQTVILTSLVMCSVHPDADVKFDLWKQVGGSRYYLALGKVLKGGDLREPYALPLKAQALTGGEILRASAYGFLEVKWVEESPSNWATIDWFGLFVSSNTGAIHANLTVFRI